ncbi:MAG: 2-hydroxyacyl-CoA dehydratase [Candidatus Tectomicrobia bacterium]|uniref:2-hydroxyacyl-CoA dehydratase n=1 Tax=Tectimicrobiota bacterium TaxID=2528274 RepID=A0A933LPN4_UNCTE|nr:2-hydroxyacyl-CoA dehydratase [Candidatus Tectomicrobia bacterium]
MTEVIGFTSSIPIEVVMASGAKPVDLNNIFINDSTHADLIEQAEAAGFPRNVCGWIKGIYGTIHKYKIRKVIAVTQGDCSNTHALMEVLQMQGIETIPFAYPYDRDRELLKLQIEKLMAYFGVNWEQVLVCKKRLDALRAKIHKIDQLTWSEGLVTGFENHLYQVSASDMNGNPDDYEASLDAFLNELKHRTPLKRVVRLGYVGVPPIFRDLYAFLESLGGGVIYNEIQREFSMPFETPDLVQQYLLYTYPYDIFVRINDIKQQIAVRKIQGIIHYTQAFCFRQIEDLILRQLISIPILTLEGDKPTELDARSRIRIEAFLEMLKAT